MVEPRALRGSGGAGLRSQRAGREPGVDLVVSLEGRPVGLLQRAVMNPDNPAAESHHYIYRVDRP